MITEKGRNADIVLECVNGVFQMGFCNSTSGGLETGVGEGVGEGLGKGWGGVEEGLGRG